MSETRVPVFGDKPWPEQYTYVPALRVGNMVWLSGTTGTDDSGTVVGRGMREQTIQWTFALLLTSI